MSVSSKKSPLTQAELRVILGKLYPSRENSLTRQEQIDRDILELKLEISRLQESNRRLEEENLRLKDQGHKCISCRERLENIDLPVEDNISSIRFSLLEPHKKE